MTQEQFKQCTKCGGVKSFSQFHKSLGRKYGLHSACKSCERTRSLVKRGKILPQIKPSKGYCPVTHHFCLTCVKVKPLFDFRRRAYGNPTTRKPNAECRECERVKLKKWQRSERGREARKAWRKTPKGQQAQQRSTERRRGSLTHKLYNRRKDLMKHYGLTFDEYQTMSARQNHVCAICGSPPTAKHGWLCVDHDHVTGEVRGLLCDRCNRGIGCFKDSSELLERAKLYLQTDLAPTFSV